MILNNKEQLFFRAPFPSDNDLMSSFNTNFREMIHRQIDELYSKDNNDDFLMIVGIKCICINFSSLSSSIGLNIL